MALLDGGGYAEQAVAPEGFVMHIPDRLGFEEAAGIPEVGVPQHAGATQPAGVAPALALTGVSNAVLEALQPGLAAALVIAAVAGWLLHVGSCACAHRMPGAHDACIRTSNSCPQSCSSSSGPGADPVLQTFITAYLELIMLGQLKKGQSVLIHAGASGVGEGPHDVRHPCLLAAHAQHMSMAVG